MKHHAFGIEAEVEVGIEMALVWTRQELGMRTEGNPDISVLRYGLFSVTDARRVTELAAGAAFAGESKVVIIAASRAYHEAQNALLKVFEEPPVGTYLFLILPSMGNLLPTLRSRIQLLKTNVRLTKSDIPEVAETFLKASKEKRSALIKKLAIGRDEDERRENRDTVLTIVNGIEAVVYLSGRAMSQHKELLEDIATLRGYLHERSAPVRMILEHLSLVVPKGLV